MNDFENKLQKYAEGAENCLHPINKVVDLPNGDELCTLCGKVFEPMNENQKLAARVRDLEAALEELKTSNKLLADQLHAVAKGRTENGWTLVAPQWLEQVASLLEEPS